MGRLLSWRILASCASTCENFTSRAGVPTSYAEGYARTWRPAIPTEGSPGPRRARRTATDAERLRHTVEPKRATEGHASRMRYHSGSERGLRLWSGRPREPLECG